MLVNIIEQQHHFLSELFAKHQESLIQLRLDLAQQYLEQFSNFLHAHMQLEEAYIFSAFAEIKHQSRWDVSLYIQEHQKIKKILEDIKTDLNWLIEQNFSGSDLNRNIIAFIDKQKTLKGLNSHHEDREETAMLVDLEQQLDETKLRILVSDIKLTWAEVMAAIQHNEH